MADGSGSGPLAGPVRRRHPPRSRRPARPRLRADAGPAGAAAPARRAAARRAARAAGATGACRGSRATRAPAAARRWPALIDLERLRVRRPPAAPASAPGCSTRPPGSRTTPASREGVSLRDVIKAFYNYGVCSEKRWPYVAARAAAGRDRRRARARRAQRHRSAPTTGCGRTSTPTTRRCTRPARCWSRPSCTTAGCPSGSRRRRARSCRRSPASARRRSAPRSHAFADRRLHAEGLPRAQLLGPRLGRLVAGPRRAADPGRRALALRRLGRPDHGRLGAAARRRRRRRLRIFDRRHGARLRRRHRRALDAGARHPRQLPAPRRRRVRRPPASYVSSPQTLRGDRAAADREEDGRGRAPDLRRRPARPEGRRRARRPLEAAGARRGLAPVHRPLVRRLRRAARAVLDGRLRRGDDPRRQARAAVRPRRRGAAPTASAARSGATSAAPPSTARATAGRCTSWSAPACGIAAARGGFGLRIVAESEGAFALAALLGVLARPAFAAEAAAVLRHARVGRPRRAADDRRRVRARSRST